MLEHWNNTLILSPSINTYKSEENIDIQQLMCVCNYMNKVLSNQSPLHKEAAVCSRFIYKFDKKFRHDIGFRYLRKLNTALLKYLSLNLSKDVENYKCLLPDKDDERYLPTRQMLEYLMVRLLAFIKIILRVCTCSKQAGIFYLDRIKRGESHWMSLMPYALLCRVWSISRVLLQQSCSWYTNLYPYLNKFKVKGTNFLQPEYTLPNNIEEWLNMKDLENFGRFQWSQKKQLKFDQLFIEDDEGDIVDNIIEFVNKINDSIPEDDDIEMGSTKNKLNEQQEKNTDNVFTVSVDHGEKISRDLFTSFFKTSSVPQIQHSVERVTNKKSLHQFIETEENFRNESSNQSLTSHLSFMQWQTLKTNLLNLYESLSNNRKIERKFKKIWKEKCLDYK